MLLHNNSKRVVTILEILCNNITNIRMNPEALQAIIALLRLIHIPGSIAFNDDPFTPSLVDWKRYDIERLSVVDSTLSKVHLCMICVVMSRPFQHKDLSKWYRITTAPAMTCIASYFDFGEI